jgi:hypothetical protein
MRAVGRAYVAPMKVREHNAPQIKLFPVAIIPVRKLPHGSHDPATQTVLRGLHTVSGHTRYTVLRACDHCAPKCAKPLKKSINGSNERPR